jgi:hypothetical protein
VVGEEREMGRGEVEEGEKNKGEEMKGFVGKAAKVVMEKVALALLLYACAGLHGDHDAGPLAASLLHDIVFPVQRRKAVLGREALEGCLAGLPLHLFSLLARRPPPRLLSSLPPSGPSLFTLQRLFLICQLLLALRTVLKAALQHRRGERWS